MPTQFAAESIEEEFEFSSGLIDLPPPPPVVAAGEDVARRVSESSDSEMIVIGGAMAGTTGGRVSSVDVSFAIGIVLVADQATNRSC